MIANALLFDLDGVLVDSSECVRRICSDWAIARGLDPAYVLAFGQGRRAQDMVRGVAPHLDIEKEVATLVSIEARTTAGLYAVPGAGDLLASLPPGSWAVVTSGTRAVATLRLGHVQLPIPRTFVTGDDVENGKPHPEGYLAAARALGCTPAECIVVEDAPAGIDAACAAGMRSIAIAGTFPAEALTRATVVLSSLDRLRVKPDATGRGRLHISWDEAKA
jgi:sugar-phosphatase